MRTLLRGLVEPALAQFQIESIPALIFDIPQNEAHGDFSTNIALLLSKRLKRSPRDVASAIIGNLECDPAVIEKIEIAGPGFINFYFSHAFLTRAVADIHEKGPNFGKSGKYKGKRANVEFVSANPTGPLTVGHGRNAVCGDNAAQLLEWAGYTVDREYYFNNAGRQMRVLGDSLRLRYLQQLGEEIAFPDDYYQGEYITGLAKELIASHGSSLRDEPAEGVFKEKAEAGIFLDIKQTLERLGIRHDIFFNENSLYNTGRISGLLETFRQKGLSYEKEGAVWLKLSELGNEQDKVIVKSTGEPTYRLPDIAYHVDKFERGYDLLIDVFGSDHAATYPDVLAAVSSLGYDTDKVKVLIHQFVTVVQGTEIIKMSTRKANYIALDELIDEVGTDVVRYFFAMRSISSHMNFDIEIAKKQSDENPVFYLQYAHARICSVLRMAAEQGLEHSIGNLSVLQTPEEVTLLKLLGRFPDTVLYAAENFEAHRLASYLTELAEAFHKFYTVCRILGTPPEISSARLALALAVRTVLRNGLGILGVSAPERM